MSTARTAPTAIIIGSVAAGAPAMMNTVAAKVKNINQPMHRRRPF